MDLKKAEERLILRLGELGQELKLRDDQTSELLPEDFEDASPVKEQMEILESEERQEVAEIAAVRQALARLKEGVYGQCVSCGRSVGEERLEAVPWAERCMPCQNELEKRSRKRI